MAQLEQDTYNRFTQSAGELLLAALPHGPDKQIAACPEWNLSQLVAHCGQVWNFMTQTMAAGTSDAPSHGFPDAPEDAAEVGEWAKGQLDALMAQLNGLDITQEIWNFGPNPTADFFPRRMAHETVIHRWDAQNALGTADPIDSDLAADGIDEMFEVQLSRTVKRVDADTLPTGSLHLHRTDGEGEWMLQMVDGNLEVTQEHGKGDAAVRGSASDLVLFINGRGLGETCEVFGDEAVAHAWAALAP